MNFLALATDYDGTLASSGKVTEATIQALEALSQSGRKLLLVTGRQLPELIDVFPRHDLFEWIVAENGAVLYCPRTRASTLLAEPVPPHLPDALRSRGIQNFATGDSVLATWRPNECTVLEVLRDLGLERQIIFNKDAIMVLPTGTNKASGLTAALEEMKISRHNVVAVGDAENDLPMLKLCECGVAVANALDSVKEKADFVTSGERGAGVEELIQALLKDDLAELLAPTQRPGLLLGKAKAGPCHPVLVPSLGQSVLVAGPSGSGKSTSITGLIERMATSNYQFCILDPEGDYESFPPAINLGNPHYVPSADEVLSILDRMYNVVVNLLGVSLDERPQTASELLRRFEHLRAATGRPHWFIIDEAHHIFPSDLPADNSILTGPPKTSLLITVHPQHVRKEALATIDIVIAVGKDPDQTVRDFCSALGIDAPELQPVTLEKGEVLVWFRQGPDPPFVVTAEPGKIEHKRHVRKYAEGDLGVGSFVFEGPEGKLHLVAHNLNTFIRMAEGVDQETWSYHLRSGHLSEWFRWIVKNRELADEVHAIEQEDLSADDSKRRLIEAIQARYTLPS